MGMSQLFLMGTVVGRW
jgi:hypothetical protein